jgi:hypothetical protein
VYACINSAFAGATAAQPGYTPVETYVGEEEDLKALQQEAGRRVNAMRERWSKCVVGLLDEER